MPRLSAALLLCVCAFPAMGQECSYATVAGLSVTFRGDNGPVRDALFNGPAALAVARGGAIYLADTGNHRVRRIDPDGTVRPVAGSGASAFAGDGGPATAAALRGPSGLAVSPNGTVYVSDTLNHRIRRIAPDGTITTIAGDGHARFRGDNGPATRASLNKPTQLGLDSAENLYILDSENGRIRRVDAGGVITTVVGANPLLDYNGLRGGEVVEGTRADQATGVFPSLFGVAPDGTLYFADTYLARGVWQVGADGKLRLWLPFGSAEKKLGSATPVGEVEILFAGALYVGSDGAVYVDSPGQLLTVRDGIATRVSDSLTLGARTPGTVAIDPGGGDVIAISTTELVRQPVGGARLTLWKVPSPASLPTRAYGSPLAVRAVANAPDGGMYVAETDRILYVDETGTMRLVAGSPTGSVADGNPALSTRLLGIRSLAVDSSGGLYFVEVNSLGKSVGVKRIGGDGIVRNAIPTIERPAWVKVDGQDRVYVFTARGGFSAVTRYDPNGSSTVLMRDTAGGSFYWGSVSLPSNVPGMAVARDGTVYIGVTGNFSNTLSTVARIPANATGGALVPMQERFLSSAMALADDGGLYLAGFGSPSGVGGVVKKLLADGTLITVRNGAGLGFWGENGFDSEPTGNTTITDLAMGASGDLLAVDGAVRSLPVPSCVGQPGPIANGIVESATSNTRLPLAAGQLISIYGFRLGPATPLTAAPDASGHFPFELGGTQVLVNGVTSPILYVGTGQVNAIVPFSVDGQSVVPVEVLREGRRSDARTVQLGRTAPAIFSYAGVGPAPVPDLYTRMLNEDGSVNGPDKPAKLGSIVTLFGSGTGITNPAGEDAKVADLNLKRPERAVTVQVEGKDAEVLYAGSAPGLVEGVTQINLRLPSELPGRGGCCAFIGLGIPEGVPQPNRLLFYFTK